MAESRKRPRGREQQIDGALTGGNADRDAQDVRQDDGHARRSGDADDDLPGVPITERPGAWYRLAHPQRRLV
ncbi:hypothetical protein GCM10010411_91800 [Actinomadura fulvescens]|uniref:Uncharacterized protein n=1 Tax=Actinomadura fulvescens TaxID=46160 RepID=A0ABP6D7T8_9ACTN